MATQRQTVTLNPGESQVVAFEVTPAEAGSYSVSVDGLSGSFTVIGMADLVVSSLVIDPSQVYIGETVTISVTVTNVGTATGSREIVCEVT